MRRYKFNINHRQFNITAMTLASAVQELPSWAEMPTNTITVTIMPIETAEDYWKARALELENKLREVLQT